MALILKDRVKESSSSSGLGSITLGGAFPGYQTFNAAIATGSTVYYTIHNLAAGFDTEWEVGVGTFTSPATLSRDTVFSSSSGGSKINFTAGGNGLEVFITQPAEQALYTNQATGLVESSGNGANTIAFTNINASNVVMVSGTITTNAANATDITNKQYVDGLILSGTHFHTPVLVEEDVNLVAVYNQPNGAGNGVGATLTNNAANAALVVDGVSVSNTARILVYAQSNAVQNGVYTVTNPGNASAQWVLTRSTDTDTFGLASSTQLSEGSTFFVTDGNTGAGRTYTCNTQGTITFGSTNITFAEVGSAQIYAAGTGLNLSNLTFSIANTAVTANTYGNDGAVGQFTVNAQGQITNAATVSVNASAISLGTLANARTTAASANGASTIVARDTNGSFTANVVTATDVNSTNVTATTGSFTNISGNATTITNINASNITSGTIANARTTGSSSNSASTLVLRDANGAFEGGNVTAANFIGAGTTITSINASNISSGTIDNARTTAASANGASTIVSRDAGGNFAANTITANVTGSGAGLTNINASNISSGTIGNAFTTANSSNGASTIVLRDAGGAFAAGSITGTSFTGNGSAITAINASSISTGTVATARLASGTANSSSYLRGDQTWAVLTAPNNGTLTMNTSGTGLSGSATFTADQSGNSTFTVASNASSANGASTLVARDSSGNFSANTITANLTGTASSATNATTATTATNQSGGTVSATTGSFSGQITSTVDNAWLVTSRGTAASYAIIGNTGGNFFVGRDSSTGGVITGAAYAPFLWATGAYPMIFGTNGSERVRISSAGGFSVGTTSDPGAGAIYATGNITAFFSDQRLKTVSGKIENALDKVNSLSGVYYTMNDVAKANGYDSDETQVGVLAQEVEAVLPEIVKPAPFDLDENNNSKSGENYKTVQYEKLVPLLIEAIKELKAEVDALKGK